MRLFLLLLPWLELWILIELGSDVGGLNALLYVFLTLMFGLWLIRRQGEGMLLRVREQVSGYSLGPQLFVDDLAMVVCGVLIMIPGLISDTLGLLFMIAPLRRQLFGRAKRAAQPGFSSHSPNDRPERENITIDGDFDRLDD
jgi:UPF0716 protein FxsA